MSVADDVAAEIDRQVDFLHRCRSVFPRLHKDMVGQTEFEAPEMTTGSSATTCR